MLAATFNHDTTEVSADPVHLMYVLEQAIRREQLPPETEKRYIEFIKTELAPRYAEFTGKEIQRITWKRSPAPSRSRPIKRLALA